MEQQTNIKEVRREFLEAVANEYGLSLKYKKVFIARFDDNTPTNSELADDIGISSQDFQDHLGEICKKLGLPSSGRGRSRKGESPWEKTYKWLWGEKFKEFQRTTVTTSSSAEAKVLIHRQTFQDKLTQQKRLTSNSLTFGDGISFGTKDIYVPLGLIERKLQPLIGDDFSPEQGSKLYEPTEYEVTRRLENTEFFDLVLKQGQTPKSHGKRIAVIGEPGAGKTTLLQQIADWVFHNNDTDVAIWVSLADLQGKTIEEYLLGVWLKDACKSVRVSPDMEEALAEMFNKGRVWLLLDGVDEMSVNQSNPLTYISRQLQTGWVSNARVVLTCRLNVWDAGKNALEEFDTYRTLEFDYGDNKQGNFDKVNEFITRWFALSNPQLGISLRTALEQPGKERIKDLVKNPLRLTLMCASWQRRQGELPETKAALYRRFVETFYQWKEEYLPTGSETRRELNQALGKLAVHAISQSSSRFRLTYSYVSSFLGERDTPLFQLATQIGWLNQVGVAQEDPDEPVYAFYHPTFQEYFAACVVDNWDFFFNHIPENPDLGSYRIFEPQWKEVILLWFGRENVNKGQKENFIKALLEFQDGCKDFYTYQAFFIAAIGVTEFRECCFIDKIAMQLIQYAYGAFDKNTNQWVKGLTSISDLTRKILKEIYDKKIINLVAHVIKNTEDDYIRVLAAYDLGQFQAHNQTVVESLVKIIEKTTSKTILWMACDALKEHDLGNINAVNKLSYLIKNSETIDSLMLFNDALGLINNTHQTHLDYFFELWSIPFCQDAMMIASNIDLNKSLLEQINIDEIKVFLIFIKKILMLIPNQLLISEINYDFSETKVNITNQDDLKTYLHILYVTVISFTKAWQKGSFNVNNEIFIYLENCLSSKSVLISLCSALVLNKVLPAHTTGDISAKNIILNSKDPLDILLAAFVLSMISPDDNYILDVLLQLTDKYKDNLVVWFGANLLIAKLKPANKIAIMFQAWLIDNLPNDSILNFYQKKCLWILSQQVAINLGKVEHGNFTAICTLINIILSTSNYSVQNLVSQSLQKIAQGNEIVINLLIQLLDLSQEENIRQGLVYSIQTTLSNKNYDEVVLNLNYKLTEILLITDISLYNKYYSIIFHCAENISYPQFLRIWKSSHEFYDRD